MKRLLASTALALALTLTAAARAQAPSGTAGGAGSITQQQPGEYLADDVIGASVRNAQNEDIGTVSDLVIDRGGQVRAAIVSVGGFLGIGDKHVAVPWDQVQIQAPAASGSAGGSGATGGAAGTITGSSRSPALTVNMTKDQLKQAPAYRTASEQRREEERSRTAPSGTMGTGTTAPGTRTPSQ